MATAHKLTNKNFSEWQVDQALAFAKESIDSRFCPGYAMKNPTLVGILMQMQMNLEMRLDAQDLQNEVEQSTHNFEESNPKFLFDCFDQYEREAKRLVDSSLPLPAYDYTLKSAHTFNLLEARGCISVTERAGYIKKNSEFVQTNW